MIRYDARLQRLAICLAALAGYVDALGFLKLGGLFISFMSGNSTRLAAGIAGRSDAGWLAGALIALFVLGVVAGAIVARLAARRKPVVLALVSMLLGLAALLDRFALDHGAIICMVLAMGAANAVFQRGGEVSIGITYMTGTLVKLGQHLAAALMGGDRRAWLPYLLLWASLVLGAIAGATVYARIGLSGLWIAAGFGAILTIYAVRIGPAQDR